MLFRQKTNVLENFYEAAKSKYKKPPFPQQQMARYLLPHPVKPQKRNLIRDTEQLTKVVSNLLIRVYSVVSGSQTFVRDETPRSCK